MVLEKKEEVTALGMRLQALDKDLDWRKEVTGFFWFCFFVLFVCLFFFFAIKVLHKYSVTAI